ncbi:large subunit ribosomal protein L35Ae [Pancytospora philotis]|nr:large subunit ribosomal protein L35Ae [Pancytospora philotis]
MSTPALLNTTIPAIFVSHKRSQRRIHPRYALLEISGVKDRNTAENYMNNAVYMCWTNKEGELVENRGVIRKHHGNRGTVRAVFQRNLNPKSIGQTVYVKLYKVEDLPF